LILFIGVNQLQHSPAGDFIYSTHFIPMEYYPNAQKYTLPQNGQSDLQGTYLTFYYAHKSSSVVHNGLKNMRQDHFLLQFLGHGTQNVSKHKIRP
jgi:hypothetical protein